MQTFAAHLFLSFDSLGTQLNAHFNYTVVSRMMVHRIISATSTCEAPDNSLNCQGVRRAPYGPFVVLALLFNRLASPALHLYALISS